MTLDDEAGGSDSADSTPAQHEHPTPGRQSNNRGRETQSPHLTGGVISGFPPAASSDLTPSTAEAGGRIVSGGLRACGCGGTGQLNRMGGAPSNCPFCGPKLR